MPSITSSVGVISGINSRDVIDQLMQLEARPKTLLQTRIDGVNQQKLAYTDLQTRLTSLRLSASSLKKPSSFQAATSTSGDENVLTATASNGAQVGSYQFQVARLVTAQQSMTRGFSDYTAPVVGTGTLSLEMGGGEITSQTALSELRGGEGIHRGSFRITDRSGKSAVVDISAAVTLDDVLRKINTALDVSVRATVVGDQIKFEDRTGLGAGSLIVQDMGVGHAAEDLGIVFATSAASVTGTDIHYLGRSTDLTRLNDGRGIRTAGGTSDDLRIQSADGSSFDISVGTAKTMGEVIDAINAKTGSSVTAELIPSSNRIRLVDHTGGGGAAMQVSSLNGSKAPADLGILGAATGPVFDGGKILSSINSVLLNSLKGGSGIGRGTFTITDRGGAAHTVDLASNDVFNVQGLIDVINNAGGGRLTAGLNHAGNGIDIIDASGGTGPLVITDVSGTAAADLGIATAGASADVIHSGNLQRQWVTENTRLSTLNGGKGVPQGRFKITNSLGTSATVDLSQGNELTLADVISEINAKNLGVTARINDHGDGLLLEDTNAGAQKLTIADLDAGSAKALNIMGTADATTIDGTWEKSIAITATDTLESVQKKINDLGFGVTASIMNDGSGTAPYRLSLSAANSGRAGRVVIDAGDTLLAAGTLVESQDAAVFVGDPSSERPLLITAAANQISGVIKGVTLDLHGISREAVSVTISRSPDTLVTQITNLVKNFNEMADKIAELTQFDPKTNTKGLLLGEGTVQQISSEFYAAFTSVVAGGKYRVLADVGLRLGDGAKIEFDEDKFRQAFASDADAVSSLFTKSLGTIGGETSLSQLNAGRGVRSAGTGLDDFQVTLRDGTTINVGVDGASTLNDVLGLINAAGGTRLKAELKGSGDGIRLTDLTGGAGKLSVSSLNGSPAIIDLKLNTASNGTLLDGGAIVSARATRGAGIGVILESRINKLIDPVNGVIPLENKTLEGRTTQFESRIKSLDKLLDAKRLRLERQFSQLESVLAGLQNQQQSIGQIKSVTAG